jgi:hypothetical protein
VDSFLGLQYAALRAVDAMTINKALKIRRLNGLNSYFNGENGSPINLPKPKNHEV